MKDIDEQVAQTSVHPYSSHLFCGRNHNNDPCGFTHMAIPMITEGAELRLHYRNVFDKYTTKNYGKGNLSRESGMS